MYPQYIAPLCSLLERRWDGGMYFCNLCQCTSVFLYSRALYCSGVRLEDFLRPWATFLHAGSPAQLLHLPPILTITITVANITINVANITITVANITIKVANIISSLTENIIVDIIS